MGKIIPSCLSLFNINKRVSTLVLTEFLELHKTEVILCKLFEI